jgi:hypothetical protein
MNLDFNKLISNERISAAQVYGISPDKLNTITLVQGRNSATEIVDLYIAKSLVDSGVNVPKDLNLDLMTKEYYLQLAPIIYLPTEFTSVNIERAKRIIRIIRDYQNEITLMPVIFRRPGTIGDFGWMINQQEYQDTLFLFNDNEEQFISIMDMKSDEQKLNTTMDETTKNNLRIKLKDPQRY